MKTDYDYIIVGAGSSGCVLANRLSADPAVSVCLIEAGSHDNSLRIQTPAGTITLYKSKKYSWNFFSAPQKNLNGRSLHTPRGKALGGSSSMNSMIYIRGHASDYDRWAQAGCPGWDWNSVLPYFKKSENNRLGQDPRLHGTTGELNVEAARDPNPVSQRFVKAAQQIGIRRNDDFNGDQLEGCGIYNLTQKDARRLSSYRAFVAPVLDRPNLTVLTDCSVQSLVIEARVTQGVRVESEGQQPLLTARREVILSAGSLGSPSLLLASGIGPANDLTAAGIKVEHDLPGVGKNLQDHLDGLITVRSKSPLTLGFSLGSLPSILTSPLRYLFGKKGWLTTNYVEAGGFARTPLAQTLPDVQFHFVPGYRSHRGRLFEWGHGYAVHTCADGMALQQLVATVTPEYAILDLRMPGANGVQVLEYLKKQHPDCVVLLLTGYGSIATAIQALKLGAHDYLSKPADADQIEAALLGSGKTTAPEPPTPSLERVEWEHLQRVLADQGGNISQTARALGIDRRSLQRKLQKIPPRR